MRWKHSRVSHQNFARLFCGLTNFGSKPIFDPSFVVAPRLGTLKTLERKAHRFAVGLFFCAPSGFGDFACQLILKFFLSALYVEQQACGNGTKNGPPALRWTQASGPFWCWVSVCARTIRGELGAVCVLGAAGRVKRLRRPWRRLRRTCVPQRSFRLQRPLFPAPPWLRSSQPEPLQRSGRSSALRFPRGSRSAHR